MSWRKDILPVACVLVLFGLIHLAESCTVGSNFNYQSCGVCNFDCTSVPNTIASCTDGLCDCRAGWANCDQDNSNGCETPIPSNLVGFKCYGTGRNGKLEVQFGTTRFVGNHRAPVIGSVGSTTISAPSGFGTILAGDLVIIHQSQVNGAVGAWEYNRVLGFSGSSFVLEAPLMRNYVSRAQIVAVPEFTDAVVAQSSVTAPNWDGEKGGILPMMVSGTLTLSNGYDITMDGRGYRGQSRGCRTCEDGVPGEGHSGIFSSPSRANVGSGGGGGGRGRDCGSGGAGGYASNGGDGAYGTSVCSSSSGVSGGSGVGGTNLRTAGIFMGGAGGEGGADEDGGQPGAGGSGGGIIIINAKTIALGLFSRISSNGNNGGDGQNNCGGSGCGMAGGGGGAGGGVRVITNSLSGSGAIVAFGGNGGDCTCSASTCGCNPTAPDGSFGRIEIGPAAVPGALFIVPAYFTPA